MWGVISINLEIFIQENRIRSLDLKIKQLVTDERFQTSSAFEEQKKIYCNIRQINQLMV